MHFSIYIPKAAGANPAHLAGVGLGDLIQPGDVAPDFMEVLDKGPDGAHGQYVSWPGSEPAYRPGQLKWFAAKPDKSRGLAAGRYWWGINPDQPVTPDDLIRQTTLKGQMVKTKSGFWLMPNLLLLPHEFDLNDDGDEVRIPAAEYSAIADRCRWCYETIKSGIEFNNGNDQATPFPEAELRRYAVEMLTKNYRLFRELTGHMRLLNDDNWLGLAGQTVDMESLVTLEEELQKKRA